MFNTTIFQLGFTDENKIIITHIEWKHCIHVIIQITILQKHNKQ